jgi:hypothetical protein
MNLWGHQIAADVAKTDGRDNTRSTLDSLHKMRSVARHSKSLPILVDAVGSCLDKLETPITQYAVGQRIYHCIKGRVAFETDEEILMQQFGFTREQAEDTELIISPEMLLSTPDARGDCDCFATLTAAMLLCAGIPVRFVAVAVDPQEPYRFSHVFCRALLDGQWVGMDTSHGHYVGWETDKPRFREVELNV